MSINWLPEENLFSAAKIFLLTKDYWDIRTPMFWSTRLPMRFLVQPHWGISGSIFDTDPQFKNISSITLLEHVAKLVIERHFEIINVDSTIVLQKPKIAPYVEQIKSNIAHALQLDAANVSVKATTNEGLGFIGAGDGAAAYAVALINSKA